MSADDDFFGFERRPGAHRKLDEILANQRAILASNKRMEIKLADIEAVAQATKDDVDRVLADQGAAIKKAVDDALAAQGVKDDNAAAILKAAQDAIDAFDPKPAPPAV